MSKSPANAAQYAVAAAAGLALLGNVSMFVWQGGRSDVASLEARLDRAITQISKQFDDLKDRDKTFLTREVHNEFKLQVERQIVRNSGVIDDLLVKKEVFDRSLADQRTREKLARTQYNRDIMMLRDAIIELRRRADSK